MNQIDTMKAPIRLSVEKQRRSRTRICMHVLGTARTDPRVMREAVALADAGYSVTVVDIEPSDAHGREEMLNGVRLRHMVMPSKFVSTRFKPWFLVKLARTFIVGAITVARERADIYHAHDDVALFATFIASRVRRKPLVFDAHELPLVAPHVTRWHKLLRLARGVLGWLTKRVTATITVSPPIGPRMRQLYGGPPAVIVRNLPTFRVVERTSRLREHFDLPDTTRIALYQGYLLPDRGLDKIVRAAHMLPDNVIIVMIGSGASEEPLKRLIAEENLESRVRMVPFLPYQELLTWTASADIGLVLFDPNYSENIRYCLPNKLFEYLMSGLPVLATPLEAVTEVIARYHVGRVTQSLDPASLGSAIGAMANDTEGLAQMRRNALVAAHEELNWETERRTLVELYDRLSARFQARSKQREA